MKLAFLGTSTFAVPALQALVDAGHSIAAVYTRTPKPAGRGQQEHKTPVHLLADSLGFAVRTPRSLRSAEEAAAFIEKTFTANPGYRTSGSHDSVRQRDENVSFASRA